jgi:transposase
MVEIKDIIRCYEKYGSIKKTAHRLDVSINTVRRYVRQMDSMDNGSPPDFLTAERKVVQPPRVLTNEVKEKIHEYLESSEYNRGKQRITAKRIQQLLVSRDGYMIGYTSVKKEVYRWKSEHSFRETSVAQTTPEGWRAEFDFVDIVLAIGNEECKFSCGVMVLPFSLYRFGRLFRHSGHLEVIQTHIDFFTEIQAVPETIFYDRLGVVYNARLKQLNESFLRFAVHYGFEPHLYSPTQF